MSNDSQQTMEANLSDSIAMLEQILEVMPHDADALQALYGAYRKLGQDSNSFEYLNRLIDVCISEHDNSLLSFIREELVHYEELYPSEVAAQSTRLRVLADSEVEAGQVEAAQGTTEKKAAQEADISEELALAWRLYEEGQLSQEEYSSVLHDLTEISSKEIEVPVSVLHVLHDRGFTQTNRILNYLSSRSGVPCINLSHFEPNDEIACALPMEFAAHEGALPFGMLGEDLLVGVLNPFNHVLVEKVEAAANQRCHTYLVESEDYDQALGRLRSLARKS